MIPDEVVNTTYLDNTEISFKNPSVNNIHSPKLSRGKQIASPLVNVTDGYIKAGRNDTAFVETSGEVDDNLASTVVIDNFKLANVAYRGKSIKTFQ